MDRQSFFRHFNRKQDLSLSVKHCVSHPPPPTPTLPTVRPQISFYKLKKILGKKTGLNCIFYIACKVNTVFSAKCLFSPDGLQSCRTSYYSNCLTDKHSVFDSSKVTCTLRFRGPYWAPAYTK